MFVRKNLLVIDVKFGLNIDLFPKENDLMSVLGVRWVSSMLQVAGQGGGAYSRSRSGRRPTLRLFQFLWALWLLIVRPVIVYTATKLHDPDQTLSYARTVTSNPPGV